MPLVNCYVSFPDFDEERVRILGGQWVTQRKADLETRITHRWQVVPSELGDTELLFKEQAQIAGRKGVQRWIKHSELFPFTLRRVECRSKLHVFGELQDCEWEDISALEVRADEDSRGMLVRIVRWVIPCISTWDRKVLANPSLAAGHCRTLLPSGGRLRTGNHSEHVFCPDFEDWQVRKILRTFGIPQLVRMTISSRVWIDYPLSSDSNSFRVCAMMSCEKRDYYLLEGQFWKLTTVGVVDDEVSKAIVNAWR